MGRKRTKVYPDYVIAVLQEGCSVHESNGSYYLYKQSSTDSYPVYCGKIMPDSTIVRRNKKHESQKCPLIDNDTSLDSLIIKNYVVTKITDYEFGFTHFILKILVMNNECLQVTDRCAMATEIILSISPDSYLSQNSIEKKRKHFFSSRKRELLLTLGKMGIHVDEVYDLLKSIRMYEMPDHTVSISKVSEIQRDFLAKWNIDI